MAQNNENALDADGFILVALISVVAAFIAFYFLRDKYVVIWFVLKVPVVVMLKVISIPFDGLFSKILFFWMDNPARNAGILFNKFWEIFNHNEFGPQLIVSNFYRQDFYYIANNFMNKSIFPYMVPFFAYFSFKLYRVREFNKHYTAMELAKQESKLWPQSKVVLWDDPLKEDITKGKWAMAQKPMAFLKHNGCIIKLPYDKDDYYEREDDKPFKIDFDKLLRVLRKQLGSPFKGVGFLNKYEYQIMAVLIAKTCKFGSPEGEAEIKDILVNEAKNKKVNALAKDLLYNLNSMYTSKPGIAGKYERFIYSIKVKKNIKEVFDNYFNHESVQKIFKKHFYKYTLFMGLFESSSKKGVFASSDFLWLKTKDRKLWFVLNNYGRHVAFTESAAPFCQFLLESYLNRKMAVPILSPVVDGFDEYLFQNYPSYVTQNEYEEI